MPKKGILQSRKAGWKLKLHYNVGTWLVNSDILLLESGPNVWDMWPGDSILLAVRKRDGYILRWVRIDGGIFKGIYDTDTFYYLDTKQITHCISLSPERS